MLIQTHLCKIKVEKRPVESNMLYNDGEEHRSKCEQTRRETQNM